MKKIKLDQAKKVVEEIIEAAKKDGGDPIAITIAGEGGIPIIVEAMDDVMPGSVNLSMKKAYTAWITKNETLKWEEQGVDPINFADSNITCFGGGFPMHPTILGSVGVSGRHSHSKDHKTIEDHELAEIAALTLEGLINIPDDFSLKRYINGLIKGKKQ